MAKKKWPFKDPDEDLDYDIKWGERLETGETIVTSNWDVSVPAGLTEHDVSIDNSTVDGGPRTKVWFSGGVEGTTYAVTNHIVTSLDRHMDQTGYIKVKTK